MSLPPQPSETPIYSAGSRPRLTIPRRSGRSPRKASGHSFPLFKIPSWKCASTRGCRAGGALQVYAKFQPPSRRRRNSLRDKLLPPRHEDQVCTVPQLPSPDLTLESTNVADDKSMNVDLGVNLGCEKEVSDDVSSGKGDSSNKDSALWDKLENWVDQYKADSEYWGIGTNPIFSLYQDTQGKVVRVTVNEEEIVKRSRIRAWSLEDKEGVVELMDVKAKISRAKLIARMIESGEYALPKNCSVVKYFVEGEKKSFLEQVRSFSVHVTPFMTTFHKTGIMLLCGCFIIWAITQFFVQNVKVELSKEEVEMLKRKVRLRMEREEFEKGRIKVLESGPEPMFSLSSRPQLDKRELMNDIREAKEASNRNLLGTGSSHLDGRDCEFDDKVREIREMARKAREIEQKNSSEPDFSDVRKDEISSELLDIESIGKKGTDDILNTKPIEQVSDRSFKGKLLPKEENINIPMHANEVKELEQEVTVNIDNVSNGKLFSRSQDEENNLKKNFHDANTLRADGSPNGEVEWNDMKSSITEDSISSISTFSSKPRVITSVQEAKEYLRQKCNMLSNKVKPYSEKDVKEFPTEALMSNDEGLKTTKSINVEGETTDATETLAFLNDTKDRTLAPELYDNQFDASMPNLPAINNVSVARPNENSCSNSELSTTLEEDIEVTGVNSVSSIPERANRAFIISTKSSKGINSSENHLGSYVENDVFYDSVCFQTKFLNVEQNDVKDKNDAQISDAIDNNVKVDTLNNNAISASRPTTSKDHKVFCSQDMNDIENERILVKETKVQEAADGFGMMDNQNSSIGDIRDVIAGSVTKESSQPEQRREIASSTSNAVDCLETKKHVDEDCRHSFKAKVPGDSEAPQFLGETLDNSGKEHGPNSFVDPEMDSSCESNVVDCLKEEKVCAHEKSWIEENFQELDPVLEKIGVGFKENYMAAKEIVQKQPTLDINIDGLRSTLGNGEHEWMNDEHLQKIVFQVRENELAGRDPFHSMVDADKSAFFKGLETLAEKENNKLLHLHEWIHSRIENLDYGSEGISVYDPVEKVIPRWKGPSIDKDPDFLVHHRPIITEREVTENILQKVEPQPNSDDMFSESPIKDIQKSSSAKSIEEQKILIECSDGTIRPGKKKGKEQWQHTKKWSRGFLEVYNAETDPEIKSVLRDMGKDLDRWITEKETQDVADLMTKIPKRKRRYIEKKMERIKREVQMFGAPAVASKYKEYSDEKEEDYLWWLDLSYVLCIELYTVQEGKPSVGFYSLEMAADLELNPKQYHVIAFEDPGDSKNLCYIIQAHMDMLGSGKAFVIARPPKDAFREAKSNGFSVTVFRKGELKLNVDQTLEEVEEEITEIGSKIYHDKIMRERSVDINTLMKGVAAADRSTKRRTRRTRTKKTAARPFKS